MKKTKVAALAAAALIAATTVGALAGCGGDSEHTITVFLLANNTETQFYEEYFDYMEEVLAEEGLNYKIEFNSEQETNYYDLLLADIQGGNTPDIFYVRPNELMQYKDHIVSLQDYADGAGKAYANLNDIYETALNMYRFNPETGKLGDPKDDLWAFPKDLSTQQLGYYKPLLEKFQTEIKAKDNSKGTGKLKMPWEMDYKTENYTWDDYKTICETIANSSNKAQNEYASDVPSIEILAKSFSSDKSSTTSPLIDLTNGRANATVNDLKSGAMQKAIEYQAGLIDCGGANYAGATYSAFTAKRVCFYGAVGSWEITDYNRLLGENGEWGVMPWPTEDGSTEWQGLITSAGYVVSSECAAMEKGDVAKRIAISFMSSYTQNQMVRVKKISLPLLKSSEEDYRSNNETYTPATRGVFLDVVSGAHGFFPAKYSTYDADWIKALSDDLELVWNEGAGGALAKYNSTDWAATKSKMQTRYDATKNN